MCNIIEATEATKFYYKELIEYIEDIVNKDIKKTHLEITQKIQE